jgi:hypothetical protein
MRSRLGGREDPAGKLAIHMRRASAPTRFALLVAAAATGLIGAHLIDYAILYPEPGHRSTILHLTGHGYLPTTATAALLLAVGAILATAARGALGREGLGPSWGATAARLATLQIAGFVALEVSERLAVGAPLRPLLGAVLVVGVLVQTTVAELAAAILVLVERVGAALASRLRTARARRRRPVHVARLRPGGVRPRRARWEPSFTVRAPPRLARRSA